MYRAKNEQKEKNKVKNRIKRVLGVAAMAMALAVAILPSLPAGMALAAEHPFVFTTIDFPGATYTLPHGINAGGQIVGIYHDASGKSHGFLLSDGAFSTVEQPFAVAYSDAKAIGPGGDIIGEYRLPGEPAANYQGYLLTSEGQWSSVDYPGHISTYVQRILPDGTILGSYYDGAFLGPSMHGMTISPNGATTEIGVPASMHDGATPDGKAIVGFYTTVAGKTRGYLYLPDDDNFIPFDVPGSTYTVQFDVNPAGVSVGEYKDPAGQFHGYMVKMDGVVVANWKFATIDYPGSTSTQVFGINAGGDVVGSYVTSGKTHGFLATRTQE
jgi:probable HAF family extracellular repeat protein